MQNVTIRLPTRLLAELEREADQQGVSRSEYIRDTLATRHEHERTQREYDRLRAEYEAEIAELERDLEHARARQDELRAMLKAANRRREETQALVEYVEQQDRSIVERVQSWFR